MIPNNTALNQTNLHTCYGINAFHRIGINLLKLWLRNSAKRCFVSFLTLGTRRVRWSDEREKKNQSNTFFECIWKFDGSQPNQTVAYHAASCRNQNDRRQSRPNGVQIYIRNDSRIFINKWPIYRTSPWIWRQPPPLPSPSPATTPPPPTHTLHIESVR